MRKQYENGVALIFALGLLALLMVVGLAFVSNATLARKVAQNNSSRTQARMFALSAINRAMASMMVYNQVVVDKGNGFVASFNDIYSYSGTSGNDDQLLMTDPKNSVMYLPEDDSVIAVETAKKFNKMFSSNADPETKFKGNWVNFYVKDGDNTRRIVGRAAWQVVSTSPQVVAPVFLSGYHAPYNEKATWLPRKNRWGREIDEAYLDVNNTTAFKIANADSFEDGVYKTYDSLYTVIPGFVNPDPNIDLNRQKRWFEQWFVPDYDRESQSNPPTPIKSETYTYRGSRSKQSARQLMRFNIADIKGPIWAESDVDTNWFGRKRWNVDSEADQWYARFGINSNDSASSANTEEAIKQLTADSIEAKADDTYDFKIAANDRSGLPFLRRIGRAGEIGSFDTLAKLRKQIAANFNDYCDADSVPTSDVSAATWANDTLATADQPTYTGNELTPYIYELGFAIGLGDHKGESLPVTELQADYDIINKRFRFFDEKHPKLFVRPIMKLANIYRQNPDVAKNYTGTVELGDVTVKFKVEKISFDVTYTVRIGDADTQRVATLILDNLQTNVPPDELCKAFKKEFVFSGEKTLFKNKLLFDNLKFDGANPYPVAITATAESVAAPTNIEDGNVKADITEDDIKKYINGNEGKLPDSYESGSFKVTEIKNVNVQKVFITGIDFNIERAVLAESKKVDGVDTYEPVDFVRTSEKLTWQATLTEGGFIDKDKTPLAYSKDGDKPMVANGAILGGIMNYDPRQNLNPKDWSYFDDTNKITVTENGSQVNKYLIKAVPTPDYTKDFNEINKVMAVNGTSEGVLTGLVNANKENSADNSFKPSGVDAAKGDAESVHEPAYIKDGADERYISTAVIRNAPMASPWEIGFIHRGIKWQTINIKKAADPASNSNNDAIIHTPHNGSWELPGVTYAAGDGAILDQIKMTEACSTYGKININRLDKSRSDFDEILDKNIGYALFNGVKYNEDPVVFIHNSTRVKDTDGIWKWRTDGLKTSADERTVSFTNFNSLFASRGSTAYESRAQFLNFGNYKTAFGNVGDLLNDDASQEEIIGKTINLICAEESSPCQIQMVVVAQSIKDLAGYQYRTNSKGEEVEADSTPTIGTFDMKKVTVNGKTENVYFDEITGEVKMFVTIDRNPTTGKLHIRKIDYIE